MGKSANHAFIEKGGVMYMDCGWYRASQCAGYKYAIARTGKNYHLGDNRRGHIVLCGCAPGIRIGDRILNLASGKLNLAFGKARRNHKWAGR
jgi:hypothetical protein